MIIPMMVFCLALEVQMEFIEPEEVFFPGSAVQPQAHQGLPVGAGDLSANGRGPDGIGEQLYVLRAHGHLVSARQASAIHLLSA